MRRNQLYIMKIGEFLEENWSACVKLSTQHHNDRWAKLGSSDMQDPSFYPAPIIVLGHLENESQGADHVLCRFERKRRVNGHLSITCFRENNLSAASENVPPLILELGFQIPKIHFISTDRLRAKIQNLSIRCQHQRQQGALVKSRTPVTKKPRQISSWASSSMCLP